MVNKNIIEFSGVSKQFRERSGETVNALQPSNLSVHEGEFFTLLGPSGCGKTTALRLMAGFIQPSAGEIKIEGRVFTDAGPLQGATVHAYKSYNGVISDTAFRVSGATDKLGHYKLRLPEGDYYMTAKGVKAGRRLLAYLGANPVHVEDRKSVV